MRICLLSTAYPPESTEGIARQRQTLARELVALGHEVFVIACGAESSRIEGGVAVQRMLRGQINSFSMAYPSLDGPLTASQLLYEGLAQLATRVELDIVDIPLWQAQGLVTLTRYAGATVLWLQTTTAQLVEINGVAPTRDQRALMALEQRCLAGASGVLADSEAALHAIGRDYGAVQGRPQGVALLGLPPLPDASAARAPRPTVTALVVGRLEQRKGTHLLFAVLPALLREHPHLHVHFLGRDNSANDGWRQATGLDYPGFFRQQHPALAGRVRFEGYVSEQRLAACYQEADLLLAPSLYESFGLVYLEAMRAGLPVVAFDAGGAHEIFAAGCDHGAILAPPGDTAALSRATQQLIQDAALRRRLGAAGLERFESAFSARAMAEATLAFYERVRADHPKVRQ
jgi:glycogen synthase